MSFFVRVVSDHNRMIEWEIAAKENGGPHEKEASVITQRPARCPQRDFIVRTLLGGCCLDSQNNSYNCE